MSVNISNEKFADILIRIVNESLASNLFTIPGVYELVAEEYNNDVLSAYKEELSNEEV